VERHRLRIGKRAYNISEADTVEYLLAQSDVNPIPNHTPPQWRRHFWQRSKAWWRQAGGGS
jgi:hypothetical protein